MTLSQSRAEIRARLRVFRDDPAGVRHTDTEYNECINQALRVCPPELLPRVMDASLLSESDTWEYDLDFITDRARPDSVQRVWMERGEDEYEELGRWWVADYTSTVISGEGSELLYGPLRLVLDELPADGRTIRVEYVTHWDNLESDDEETACDTAWLIAQAMILLIRRDRSLTPGDKEGLIVPWELRAEVARREACQRPRGKARTYAW